MNKTVFLSLILISAACAKAQPTSVLDTKIHKMVVQFTQGDSVEQVSVTAQVRNIKALWPNAQIEVVCQGTGLELLMNKKSKAAKAVADWSAQGVVFAACNNTMKRFNVKKEDLLPSAVIVPSAMVELVQKQEEGWAYLKGAH